MEDPLKSRPTPPTAFRHRWVDGKSRSCCCTNLYNAGSEVQGLNWNPDVRAWYCGS